jgi:RNA polymerase sigma-70 factor (ECF subfamily)
LKALFPRLLKRFTRFGRSQEETEDLIQEACLRLYEYYGAGHAVVNEEAFLYRTAKNLATDRYRKAQRHPHVQLEEFEQNEQIYDSAAALDEVLDGEQRLEKIERALDEQSVRMRKMFSAYQAGYTQKEIAILYAVSKSTVEKSITRAFLTIMEMRGKE